MSTAVAPDLSGIALQEELERVLAEPVEAVRSRERTFPGTYESCVLEVRLASGRETRLFLKDLGSCPDFKLDRAGRRARELYMYRDVLSAQALGTAHYYGCPDDRWLLLEYVDGMPLRYRGIPDWHRAARWLGRMHGSLAGRIGELRESGRLPVVDERQGWEVAARGLRSVYELSPQYEDRLARALRRWDLVVDALVEGPLTLVHSAYRPAEILIEDNGGEPRVCPVDWENASIGSTLFDLAMLTDGFAGTELDELVASYRDEAARHYWDAPSGERARFVIDCLRLYNALILLGHASRRGYPAPEVESIVEGVERMAAATLD